jgi:L-ribulose-5-phosphate 4-epimerase
MNAQDEGVINFKAQHQHSLLSTRTYSTLSQELSAWRSLFWTLQIIGQNHQRYQGAGYGNVSARITPFNIARGHRPFMITGTQTGHKESLSLDEYSIVTQYQLHTHTLSSYGQLLPSSESMTHAALYDLNPCVRYIFHAHAPCIWHQAKNLKLPITAANIAYGSLEMVYAVQRLYQQGKFSLGQVLVMKGHQDGVMSCGTTAEEAGQALIQAWVHARQ